MEKRKSSSESAEADKQYLGKFTIVVSVVDFYRFQTNVEQLHRTHSVQRVAYDRVACIVCQSSASNGCAVQNGLTDRGSVRSGQSWVGETRENVVRCESLLESDAAFTKLLWPLVAGTGNQY